MLLPVKSIENGHDVSPPRSRSSRSPTTPAYRPPSTDVDVFRVDDAGFIAGKRAKDPVAVEQIGPALTFALGADAGLNSLQGIRKGGRVEFDLDWSLHA